MNELCSQRHTRRTSVPRHASKLVCLLPVNRPTWTLSDPVHVCAWPGSKRQRTAGAISPLLSQRRRNGSISVRSPASASGPPHPKYTAPCPGRSASNEKHISHSARSWLACGENHARDSLSAHNHSLCIRYDGQTLRQRAAAATSLYNPQSKAKRRRNTVDWAWSRTSTRVRGYHTSRKSRRVAMPYPS